MTHQKAYRDMTAQELQQIIAIRAPMTSPSLNDIENARYAKKEQERRTYLGRYETMTRAEEINEQAAAFHSEHPQVAVLFITYAFEVIERGFKNYSANSIFERIRWETDQADTDGKSIFKLNNNYRCWYSRRFMERYPEHEGFFRTRFRTSSAQNATNLPELGPEDFE